MRRLKERVLGIPVFYDESLRLLAVGQRIWPFKRIVVGRNFPALSPREQGAVLLHEAGHCKLYHLEKRLLRAWMPLVYRKGARELACEQEFEADRYAAGCGYGLDLVALFSRMGEVSPGQFHPEFRDRIARLTNNQGA